MIKANASGEYALMLSAKINVCFKDGDGLLVVPKKNTPPPTPSFATAPPPAPKPAPQSQPMPTPPPAPTPAPAATSTFTSISAGGEIGKWQCPQCDATNLSFEKKCFKCGTGRP